MRTTDSTIKRTAISRRIRNRLKPGLLCLAITLSVASLTVCRDKKEGVGKENKERDPQRTATVDATDSVVVEESPLRQFDAFIGRWLGASAGTEVMEDLVPKSDWRIDLHRVGTVFGRARIDIGRDGVWNENWELRNGQVFRTVHEENGDVVYRLDHTIWTKQLP